LSSTIPANILNLPEYVVTRLITWMSKQSVKRPFAHIAKEIGEPETP
jgi:hypothetical protein